MKLLVVCATVLFVAANFARADLVIVQKVEGGGQTGEQTIKIKGDKARTELNPAVTIITDGATGGMTTLMHTGHTYLKVSPEQTKSMMDQLQKYHTGAEPAKLQPTGKKEKIGEYECDIYTAGAGGLIVTYWLAPSYPNYQSMIAQLAKFQASTISPMGKGLLPDMKDFPGMPIKTEMDANGKKIVTTLLSAKEDNVDPKSFDIPASYKEITSPALNFQPPNSDGRAAPKPAQCCR